MVGATCPVPLVGEKHRRKAMSCSRATYICPLAVWFPSEPLNPAKDKGKWFP